MKGRLILVLGVLVLGGCSNVSYKHPQTGAVAECEPQMWNWYPGACT